MGFDQSKDRDSIGSSYGKLGIDPINQGKLTTVIDPETGVDVMRMKLVQDLVVTEDGKVSYKFRPSSPLCPIRCSPGAGHYPGDQGCAWSKAPAGYGYRLR